MQVLRKDPSDGILGVLVQSLWELHLELDDQVAVPLWVFGEWESLAAESPLHPGMDDLRYCEWDGASVQSGGLHCVAAQSLTKEIVILVISSYRKILVSSELTVTLPMGELCCCCLERLLCYKDNHRYTLL